jgi:serine protease DegQ
MKRTWLLFAQAVTILLAGYFVYVAAFGPGRMRGPSSALDRVVSITQAPESANASVVAAGSFSPAAKKAAPAVVSINTSRGGRRSPNSNDPGFRFFFGDEAGQQPRVGLGSGVIVSADGYILTNNHVVEGADEIAITLNDSRHARGKVIGTDPDTDLAVLKVDLDKLPPITLGNSDGLQVGDQVLAIGNPFGVGQTVTAGIVSALGRSQLGINTFENFIQTDAAINPGNSGGALVDMHGNLQGINTAIYSRSGGSMGIGFAIPTSTAKHVLRDLVTEGKVTRGWIGVEPNDLSPELARTFGVKASAGAVVIGVLQGGPAARAGIRAGDVITRVGDKSVGNVQELLSTVAGLKPGNPVEFQVQRGTDRVQLPVTPSPRPSNPIRQ